MLETSFRAMVPADIAAGLRLCRVSRWNQLSSDWELFLKLSPNGCSVALKHDQVVGTVVTLRYQDRFSWIAMVLVDPAERHQGLGTQLLHQALEILGDMKTIRLDATPAGQVLYQNFNFTVEYGLSRMEANVSGHGLTVENSPARPMTQEDLPGVFELDREVFGADRSVILQWMFSGAPEYAWAIGNRDRIEGYLFGRHGHSFEHLGPLIAPSPEHARHLVSTCVAKHLGMPFILDVPHHSTHWLRWLESIGFIEQRPFMRMFRGENRYPGLPEKQLAILGPEFG